MNLRQTVSVLGFVLGLGIGPVSAQMTGPAELPPASYTSKQYVDSRGCVFVRAGLSGNVNWVPRVTRQREPICGMQPSLGGQTRTAAAAPQRSAPTIQIDAARPAAQSSPAPAPASTRPTALERVFQRQPGAPIDTVASIPPAAQPQPQAQPQTRVQIRAPQPQPRVVTRQPVAAPTPAPERRVATAPPAPRVTRPLRTTPSASVCPNGGRILSRSVNGQGQTVLRCSASVIAQRPAPAAVAPTVTRPVQPQRRVATAPAPAPTPQRTPPEGYRTVWEDDRLNPDRGPRTAQGDAQMNTVWTATVPRVAVNGKRARLCTGPNAQESRYVNAQGQTVVRCTAPERIAQADRPVAQQRLSSMNAPAPRQQAKAASHRFVQVGTFGVADNATRTARRLQSSGLPVRLSRYSKGGKDYTIVLAGPFGTQSQLNAGLNRARQAGFSDAFLRK